MSDGDHDRLRKLILRTERRRGRQLSTEERDTLERMLARVKQIVAEMEQAFRRKPLDGNSP